jgi:4-amino-4-deoxy-L-arabinose transferase-like glycosyltransferase
MTHRVEKFCWICLGGIYLAFSLPLMTIGTQEIRMVAVFSIDKSDILNQVNRLYTGGLFQRPSFTYGGGIYYGVLSLVLLWDIFGVVDEQIVALALRFFCLLAGFACLGLVGHIGQRVFDKKTGQLGALLLLTMPVFLHWTVEGHPDLPQLFWVLCTLVLCLRLCRTFSVRDVALASFFAGIVFGTKYGGAFLLPIIGSSIFMTSEDGNFRFSQVRACLKMPRRWCTLALVPFIFALAFILLNPYAAVNFDLFLQKMQSYRSLMSSGHTYIGESAGYLWLSMIVLSLGAAHTSCFFAGILSEKRTIRTDRLILMLWCLVLLAYLMLNVQMRHMRHVLPVLPCLLLFVAAGYRYLASWAS